MNSRSTLTAGLAAAIAATLLGATFARAASSDPATAGANSTAAGAMAIGENYGGEYQPAVRFVGPRFTNNRDGTVTDKSTGLEWLRDANCFGPLTRQAALAQVRALAAPQCGLSTASTAARWRMPNIHEISTLVASDGVLAPALPVNHPFLHVQVGSTDQVSVHAWYWLSTGTDNESNASGEDAPMVRLDNGAMETYTESHVGSPHFLWPVRGPL